MGYDYDEWLDHDYLDIQFWRDHYNRFAQYWKESEERGLKDLGRAYGPLIQKKPEETENIFLDKQKNSYNPKKEKILISIKLWTYILTCVFYGIAILIISLGFVLT